MGGDFIVETRSLTKRYGARVVAVDALDLRVRRGEVYGFLGLNGAGKTTTLKMLLGLVRPTAGVASVLGAPPGSPEALTRVGAIVESPAFYPYLSGRENLLTVARLSEVKDRNRAVREALETVGLAERGKDRYAGYSLGMKQRLGVAAALVKDPDLLILDEPTNGLDPQGVSEMRKLIRDVGQDNRTVLLSSHLMGEVEQVCGRVGVLRKGRLIAEGTIDELRRIGGTDDSPPAGLLVRAEPMTEAIRVARGLAGVDSVTVSGGTLKIEADPSRAAEINRKLVSAGLDVSSLNHLGESRSLEEVFLRLTGAEVRENG